MTTTNLDDFGIRELAMAGELLTVLSNGYPDDFYLEGVTLMMNQYSGDVFLTNDECQVAMLNGDDLEMWYNTPYECHEGFAEDLLQELEDDGAECWIRDDVEYLIDIGALDIEDITREENPNTYAALVEYGFIDEPDESEDD